MIKYNNNTINDWNFGDDNIIKVYRNGAVCYYKITSGTFKKLSTQTFVSGVNGIPSGWTIEDV